MSGLNISPGSTDRATIVGMTGSGKTTLVRALLAVRAYVVVLDMKGLIRWAGYERHETLQSLIQSKHPRLVYAPNYIEMQDWDTIDRFFEWIYRRRNTTLYVDEVYSVCRNNKIPFYYNAVLTRGREKKISVLSAVQRPKMIPITILSESEHFYLFRLQIRDDRKRVQEITGVDEARLEGLEKYQFFYANASGDVKGPLRLRIS